MPSRLARGEAFAYHKAAMFTGIVRHVGAVTDVRPSRAGAALTVDLGPLAEGLALGDSVCVSGACLTVAGQDARRARFDVIGETLARTTLGLLRPGGKVNLERSLRLDQGLDGHLVQGHVDGVAEIRSVRRGTEYVLELAAARELTGQMVPKGSVAVDGVSLTLVSVAEGAFSVALIPTTLDETTLGRLAAGDKVNIETDIIGKYVLRYLAALVAADGGLTVEKLKQAGFV